MMKNLFLLAVLPAALARLAAPDQSRIEEERNLVSGFDYWRIAGDTPDEIECGSSKPKLDKNVVGTVIKVGVPQLCDYRGILVEECSEGGENIGWLHEGNTVSFDVALATAGLYKLTIRVASLDGDGGFAVSNADTADVYKNFKGVPTTGGWQQWRTLEAGNVGLPSGWTTVEVRSTAGGWNLQWFELEMISEIQNEIVVDAADFTTPASVELHESSEGGMNLAYLFTGDMLDFSIRLPSSGMYRVQARTSNAKNVGAFNLIQTSGGRVESTVEYIPPTRNWDSWATVVVAEIYLAAGKQDLSILVTEGGWNLGWLSFGLMDQNTNLEGIDPDFAPFVLRARDYASAKGVIVDETNANVGSIDTPGEYIMYMVDIPSTGVYTITFHVASPDTSSGSFDLVNRQSKETLREDIKVLNTGGWHNWAPLKVEDIELEAGILPLQLVVVEGFWNLLLITFQRTE